MPPAKASQQPFYIWHYDYYLSGNAPDAFSRWEPEALAEEIVSTGVNFVAIFAENQHGYAYYPSKVAPVHPSLGNRDYTGAMIDALHRRGCTVITYVNFMNIERREEHPEWWQRQVDGTQVYNNGWGVPCPNGPIKDYMKALVVEIATLYPTDGFFFDMYAFNHNGCWCVNCRRKWAEKYDLPFPVAPDWGSDVWRQYLEFRAQSTIGTMTEIRDAAMKVRPNLIWCTHCGPQQNWWAGTAKLQPVVDTMVQSEVGTRRGKGLWAAGQRAKILQPFSRGKPNATILADIHLYWDKPKGWFYIPWAPTNVQRQVAEIIAHGSWPDIYTEPYPDGRNNPYTTEGVREGIMLARKFEPYLLGRETVRSVALHYSQLAHDFFGREEPEAYSYSF
ncbi:MAG: alpha-L-fucosidase, partial [Anaerolineae bacterium]